MTEHGPFLRRFLVASALVGTASCSAGATADDAVTPTDVSLGSPETQGTEVDEPAAVDETVAVGETVAGSQGEPVDESAGPSIDVTPDPDNPLIAQVNVDGAVSVTVVGPDVEPRVFDVDGDQTLDIVGLRADTTYEFSAADDGSAADTTLTTGALPVGAPAVDVTTDAGSTSEGITFFGVSPGPGAGATANDAVFWGVDAAGEVVWYYESGVAAASDPIVRATGDGELLLFVDDLIQHIRLDGTVLAEYDLSAVDGWHHDAVVLENGGVLALGRENRTVDGEDLRGDSVVELDADGEVVWEWSTFDHLDTSRFPGELSTSESRAGGVDWSHANSVFIDESTGEILVSLRSQHWVVNVDRATGDINWIAGDDAGIADDFDETFLELDGGTWTTAQHTASFTEDGDLLVYDNRNESSGDTDNSRIVTYDVDAEAGTATQVFESIAPKYTQSLGDVDELSNGNLMMTAGGPGSSDTAHLVEVDADGQTVWEAQLDERIYRSERMAWDDIDNPAPIPEPDPDPEPVPDPAPDPEPGPELGDATDITDAVLTNTDAACGAYVGTYTSEVTDVSNDNEFVGDLTITTDGETCVLASNQIPNHDISVGAEFANETGEVDTTFEVDASPSANPESTDLGFTVHAVLLNGVSWEAYPAACFDEGPSEIGTEAIGCGGNLLDHPWRYDVGSEENAFRLDDYSAHSQADGLYHYHSTPEALYEIDCTGVAESPVIGFARDGFPIYGPCFADEDGTIRAAQSSYEVKAGQREDVEGFTTPYTVGNVTSDDYNGQFIGDYEYVEGAGDLDECNGMVVDGEYGYRLTGSYPYVLACYTGTPSEDFGAAGRPG